MLEDIVASFISFSGSEVFHDAAARSVFYDPIAFDKSVQIAYRLQLLPEQQLLKFKHLSVDIKTAHTKLQASEEQLTDAPDEFLDPLLCTLMRDPVLLPTSGTVIDLETITQHLLNDSTDPFSRKALSIDMIQPQDELKARIDAWVAEKLGGSA